MSFEQPQRQAKAEMASGKCRATSDAKRSGKVMSAILTGKAARKMLRNTNMMYRRILGARLPQKADMLARETVGFAGKLLHEGVGICRYSSAKLENIFGTALRACKREFSLISKNGLLSEASRLWGIARGFCRVHAKILDGVAAAFGIAVFTATIFFLSSSCFAVSVSYNGRHLGMVRNEQVYLAAVNKVEKNIADESGGAFKLNGPAGYNFVMANKSSIMSEDEIYDRIISASGDVSKGYGLYVNNDFAGAESSSADIRAVLNGILDKYKSQPYVKSAEFVQKIKISKGVYPNKLFKSGSKLVKGLTSGGNGGNGKDVSTSISLDPLYAMNGGMEGANVVMNGTSTPKLSVKVVKDETGVRPIPYTVDQINSGSLSAGKSKVICQGQNGVMNVNTETTYVDGTATDQIILSTNVQKDPVNEKVAIGTKKGSSRHGSCGVSSPLAQPAGGGVISCARSAIGVNYSFGGMSFSGFDCSGLTKYVYARYGVDLPHSAAGQASCGSYVSASELAPGDLVFFNTEGGGISHVGIYIGGGDFIDASSRNPHCVTIDSLDSRYYSNRYVTARRVG